MKNKRIIAYSYYFLQQAEFCNMLDFHCVLKYAELIGLTEFCDRYKDKMELYSSEILEGYNGHILKYINKNVTEKMTYDTIIALREKEAEKDEGTGKRTKRTKKKVRRKSKKSRT